MHSKSKKAFTHNLTTEYDEGKPMKQSLAIAYALKRRGKKEAEGGEVRHPAMPTDATHDNEQSDMDLMDMREMSKVKKADMLSRRERAMRMAEGGFVREEEAQYDPREEPGRKTNHRAMMEDDRDLGQHGATEVGPEGATSDAEDMDRLVSHDVENQFGAQDEDEDMVGRIMKQRTQSFAKGGMAHKMPHRYSEGGRVSNQDREITSDMPNEFDDLHLDDHLGDDGVVDYTGANSGDEIGDAQEDADREDIIARIMKSRAKKDRLPNPR